LPRLRRRPIIRPRRRAAQRLFDDQDIATWVDDFQRALIGFNQQVGIAYFGHEAGPG
jgi:hypothetical protein